MRLELSRRAQHDLDDIRDHGLQHYGAAQTIEYLDRIERAFRRILDHPGIGEVRRGVRENVHSLPTGSHRVFYVREEARVLVIRVLHKRMDAGRHL